MTKPAWAIDMEAVIAQLSEICDGENATKEDWERLVAATFSPTPDKILLFGEIFNLKVQLGFSFEESFKHCCAKYRESRQFVLDVQKLEQELKKAKG